MRDEYNVRGVYLTLTSTMRIKERDIVNFSTIVAMMATLSIIFHFILEQWILNNPFGSRDQVASLNRRKYYMDPHDIAENDNLYMHGEAGKIYTLKYR